MTAPYRVVVTGMGVVGPLGTGVEAFTDGLVAGRSAIRKMQPGEDGAPPPIPTLADIRDFDPLQHFDRRRVEQMDRFAHLAVVAAREAIAQSGLDFSAPDPEDTTGLSPTIGTGTAALIGNGGGGYVGLDENYRKFYRGETKRVHPLMIPRSMPSAAASQICMEQKIKGPSYAISSACSTANHAIGAAFHMVRFGQVRRALTGGTEAILAEGIERAWTAMRIVATETCRPFSKTRNGMVVGEGAGIFMLERLEDAKARGAPILGEILGFGMSSDAGDLVAPDPESAARAMAWALADAGLKPDDVDHINAHGTGTWLNDVAETKALRRVFGAHADKLTVSATKAMHGHALGGAGALELVALLQGMARQTAWPTLNYEEADPECDLDYVVEGTPRPQEIRVAMTNSFAFGGLNAVLAIGHPDR